MGVISSTGTVATPATGTGDPITGTWGTGQNRSVPNLLVAVVVGFGSSGVSATSEASGTSGWTKQYEAQATNNVVAIWTKNATGGDAAPGFNTGVSGSHTNTMCTLYELTDSAGSTPLVDTGGHNTGTTGDPLTITTAANVAGSGEYAVGSFGLGNTIISSSVTWNNGGGGNWTKVFTDGTVLFGHWIVSTNNSITSGSTLSYAVNYTYGAGSPSNEAGAIIVVKPGIPPATNNGNGFLAFFP